MAGLGGKEVNRRVIKEIVDIASRAAEKEGARETVWMGLDRRFFS
jgi:hypothetical protein